MIDEIRKLSLQVKACMSSLSITLRGYALQSGKLVLEGTARDLLDNPSVHEIYLGQHKIDVDSVQRLSFLKMYTAFLDSQ